MLITELKEIMVQNEGSSRRGGVLPIRAKRQTREQQGGKGTKESSWRNPEALPEKVGLFAFICAVDLLSTEEVDMGAANFIRTAIVFIIWVSVVQKS